MPVDPAAGGDVTRWSRRARLAWALGRSGAAQAALSARRRMRRPGPLSALVYHRVAPLPGPGGLDRDLVDATPEEFEGHLALLREWFTPVGLDDVVAARLGRRALPEDALLITFDDGYKDNHRHALPLLQKAGMRAVFFVATDFVERRRLFWWERVSLLVRRSSRQDLELEYPRPMTVRRAVAIRALNRVIKDEVDLDLERFLEEVARAAGVDWSEAEERDLADAALMTWEEVAALHRAGMDVASHTRAHRVLATQLGAALDGDLLGSRRALEELTGQRVRALAYPVGRRIDARVRAAVVRAGYALGFTAVPGDNAGDPFDLRRTRVSAGTTPEQLLGMLAFPALQD
jgi:peptidoglycan/xylan/chitin deacetylase (PgdA/CDA1 family)